MDEVPEQVPEQIGVHWKVSPGEIFLDHHPRILLLVEAIWETMVVFLHVKATELDGQPGPRLVLGHCLPAYGVRRYKVRTATPGKQFVRACGNFRCRPGLVRPLLSRDIPAGDDFWTWAGHLNELRLMPGYAVALVGSCQEPCKVKVEMAGV